MKLRIQAIGTTVGLMVILGLPLSLAAQAGAGQDQRRAQQHQHPASPATQAEMAKPASAPQVLGKEGSLRLEDLEKMALESNPTLGQAAAGVRAAEGRKLQSGLYPNPTIGATGDENTPGPIIRGGEFGFFVEQQFVTAGKLGKSRSIAEQERLLAETTAQAQKQRVLNAVRSLYYEALGAERLVQVQTQLATLSQQAVKISKEFFMPRCGATFDENVTLGSTRASEHRSMIAWCCEPAKEFDLGVLRHHVLLLSARRSAQRRLFDSRMPPLAIG